MLWYFWRSAGRAIAPRIFARKQLLLLGALAIALLVTFAACQPGGSSNAGSAAGSTPGNAAGRNYVPPGTRPQFVRVTFTTAATFEQARALLASVGAVPYPWSCSGVSSGTPSPVSRLYSALPLTTPPPSPEQDTPKVFAVTHELLLNYPTERQLNQIAASNLVIAVDEAGLPACL